MSESEKNSVNIWVSILVSIVFVLIVGGGWFVLTLESTGAYDKKMEEVNSFLMKSQQRIDFQYITFDDCKNLNSIKENPITTDHQKQWASELFDEGCPTDEYGAMIDPQKDELGGTN